MTDQDYFEFIDCSQIAFFKSSMCFIVVPFTYSLTCKLPVKFFYLFHKLLRIRWELQFLTDAHSTSLLYKWFFLQTNSNKWSETQLLNHLHGEIIEFIQNSDNTWFNDVNLSIVKTSSSIVFCKKFETDRDVLKWDRNK